MAGKVYLVGAGPGDSGLITLRGSQVLGEADVVYYGDDTNRELLELVRPAAEKRYRARHGEPGYKSPRALRRDIAERVRQGQIVVCLLSGDPVLSHHGAEAAMALAAAEIDFEIVPGLSSALASPIFAGIPLLLGGVSGSVTVVHARREEEGEPASPVPAAPPDSSPGVSSSPEPVTRPLPSRPDTDETPTLKGMALSEGEDSALDDGDTQPTQGGVTGSTSESQAGPEPARPPSAYFQQGRVGRGVVVRPRRLDPAEMPAAPGTPPPAIVLRHANVVEIVDDAPREAARQDSIEKPLLRPPESDPDEFEPKETGVPFPSPDWESLARLNGTLVIVADTGALGLAVGRLLLHGRPPDDPAAVIRWGTTNRQQSLTSPLSTIAKVAATSGITGDCLLVVGKVVAARDTLNRFEARPLFGYRVALTDFGHRGEEQARLLETEGAIVHEVPLLRIATLPDAREALLAAAERLDKYDMIVFSSPVLVRIFLDLLLGEGRDPRRLTGPRIVAISPTTAMELNRYNVRPDVLVETIPKRGLAEQLGVGEGNRVLMPRAARARDLLPLQIREGGAMVEIIPVYDTIPDHSAIDRLRKLLADDAVDLLVHGTSSGFELLWEAMNAEERGRMVGQVPHGSTNAVAARELAGRGIRPCFELHEAPPAELVHAIRRQRNSSREKGTAGR